MKKALAFISLAIVALSFYKTAPHLISQLVSDPVEVNLLTGAPGTNGTVLVVKIDDTLAAHPQIGIAQADVIYIEQVEGGLTRIAAIYSQARKDLPPKIGPVRSARISDIDILAQYGRVAFAFSGAQSKMLPVIAAANLENLSAEREPATIYSRDLTRIEPTNMILDPAALLAKAIDAEGKEIVDVKSMGWTFGDLPTDTSTMKAAPVASASIKWPASKYRIDWDSLKKKWNIFYGGAPDLDANGIQLSTSTFIIQKVLITDSIYHDKVGGITPLSHVVGAGTGYLMRDGLAIPINWTRASETEPTQWSYLNGTEAKFVAGQIWIALTDQTPAFAAIGATK